MDLGQNIPILVHVVVTKCGSKSEKLNGTSGVKRRNRINVIILGLAINLVNLAEFFKT